jgi:phosphatidylglycerophosphatase A
MKKQGGSPVRPPAGLILSTPVHFIAFAGGAGLSPYAPGTVGTLVALPLWWFLSQLLPWPLYLALLAGGFALGCWACGRSAHLLGQPDFSGIVFDEVVGIGITAFPLLSAFGALPWPAPVAWLAAFVLFRFFDIVKPRPVGWLDRRIGGGTGIMLDDAAAGVIAAVLLAVARWVS